MRITQAEIEIECQKYLIYCGKNENTYLLQTTIHPDPPVKMSSLSYFFSAVDTDTELLARAGSSVYTFILSLRPNFSFFQLFRLSLLELCLMFYRGSDQTRRDGSV